MCEKLHLLCKPITSKPSIRTLKCTQLSSTPDPSSSPSATSRVLNRARLFRSLDGARSGATGPALPCLKGPPRCCAPRARCSSWCWPRCRPSEAGLSASTTAPSEFDARTVLMGAPGTGTVWPVARVYVTHTTKGLAAMCGGPRAVQRRILPVWST